MLRLADKRGEIFTYTLDYMLSKIDMPAAITVVDLDGGGRIIAAMTDWKGERIEIGMPVEMTFRKIFTASGIHNYYWKCMPLRFKDA
jgi:uncharacterized OB-fold protein